MMEEYAEHKVGHQSRSGGRRGPASGGGLHVNWVAATHRKWSEPRRGQQDGTSLQQETPLCTHTQLLRKEMKMRSSAAPARLMSASTDRVTTKVEMRMPHVSVACHDHWKIHRGMHMFGRSEEVSPIKDAITFRKASMKRVERANTDFALDGTPPDRHRICNLPVGVQETPSWMRKPASLSCDPEGPS